jgi:hypothetical protein
MRQEWVSDDVGIRRGIKRANKYIRSLSQAILLQPTIRFIWDGALDEVGGEGWVEVVFAEGGAVAEV